MEVNLAIECVERLSREVFLDKFVSQNKPVIVRDALGSWRLDELWTPSYLVRRFGGQTVQVYDSYFNLTNLMTLGEYFRRYFGRTEGRGDSAKGPVPYVRWYTKLKDVDFIWADDAFRAFSANWETPYFLPQTDYVLPYVPSPRRASPVLDHFPAKGLFISGAGAKTGLHVDPWGSDAVLCQLYGTKRWTMYAPEQAPYLSCRGGVVDLDAPDHRTFPQFSRAEIACEFTLGPGHTVYVPHGWFHDVKTESDSISLTWNFVHSTTAATLLAILRGELSDSDSSILRFFFSPACGREASVADWECLVMREFAR